MQLENLKITFLGDSITQGSGTTAEDKIFHQIIKRDYNLAEAYKCGIGGTRIAKQTSSSFHIHDLYFSLRVDILPLETDVVVIFGGTNDFGHGDAKMGTIDSTDIYTFYGALNDLISKIKDKNKNAKIVFLTPLRRVSENMPNINGLILADYVNAIINVANKYNLPCIDLFNSNIFDPFDTEVVPDGLHPNTEGYKVIAEKISAFIKAM